MAYIRPQPKQRISKEERKQLLQEYYLHYKELIHDQGIEALNLKIPREVFSSVLDEVGVLLQERAAQLLSENEAVRQFLEKTPVPPSMASQLPEDFRVFALFLNALKQWVSAESAATDRFLLGGNARKECREVTNICLVTGKEIGDDGELHHPVRDGRPPIFLSREGHNIIEYGQKKRGESQQVDDPVWQIICKRRSKSKQSWQQLKEGCRHLITPESFCRSNAKSFANKVVEETGLSPKEILTLIESKIG